MVSFCCLVFVYLLVLFENRKIHKHNTALRNLALEVHDLLESMEFGDCSLRDGPICSVCARNEHEGHRPGCKYNELMIQTVLEAKE